MSFPATPIDGQTYVSTNGSMYRYTLATKSWARIQTILQPVPLGNLSDVAVASKDAGRLLVTDGTRWSDDVLLAGDWLKATLDLPNRQLTLTRDDVEGDSLLTKSKAVTDYMGNVHIDYDMGNDVTYTATAGFTLIVPESVPAGRIYKADLFIKQDGSGNHVMTLGPGWKTGAAGGIVLSTAANALDWLCVWSNGTTHLIGIAQLDLR
jgi:hypothetical protein